MKPSNRPRILVVGGGLVGLSIAWHLQKRGAKAIVFDQRAPAQEASAAGAGMLPLHSVAFDTPELFALSRLSYGLYPSWVEEMEEASGLDAEWEDSGSMGLLFSEKEESNARPLAEKLRLMGQKVDWIPGGEARRLEKALPENLRSALRLPSTVQIRPAALCKTAVAAVQAKGVTLHSDEKVVSLVVVNGRVTGVRTGKETVEGDAVVLATGAWAPGLLEPLGRTMPVYPLKGQVLLLQGPAGALKHILFGGGFYLVPRRSGELYVGSTLEKVGFDRNVTPEALASLGNAVKAMAPNLGPLRESGSFAGFRPGSPDGHPFLGPVPGVENLHVAVGHHTHGHLLAAATGHLMAQSILGVKPDLPLEPFSMDRKPYELQPPWWVKLST